MEAPRQAPVVDIHTGEVVAGGCAECENTRIAYDELNAKYKQTLTQLGKEKKKVHVQRFREVEAEAIVEVLSYWRDRCMSRPDRVVFAPGGRRWEKVRDRLRDDIPGRGPYQPDELKLAVDGALISPFHNGTDPKTKGKQYLDATTIFKDPEVVGKHIDRTLKFNDLVGVLPSEFLRAFVGKDVKTDLEVCGCGHFRIYHVALPESDGREVCGKCGCGGFAVRWGVE